jgi:hypothetical protein
MKICWLVFDRKEINYVAGLTKEMLERDKRR